MLIDFGIASELAQEATEASLAESFEGTLAYISPEQTGRTARGLDSRADLYSIGVTLFEMLSGRRPFVEKDALSLVYAHLAKAPPVLENLHPDIPSPVSRIVERCLEKSPERRYQTAKGLAADLERCLRSFGQQKQIELFALGQRDFSSKLQIPDTLFSREKESTAITAAFERAAQGSVELLLLGGPSGAGKTALVREVYRDIAKAGRGLLLSGKHDQLGRAIPYAALAQAFSGLMRSLTASPKPVFEEWRERLTRALGPLSRVIADLVPELEWLMGEISALPVVSTEMAYNRLKLSWIDFVRTVTDASPPLVLFLDDLQWIDPASLELLKTLLTDVGRKHLLIIAAYRDNEVEPGHALWKLIDAAEQSGVATTRLSVGPLDSGSVCMWLAAVLSASTTRVQPLAAALYHKTHGNPFFLGQLLLELHRKKRIRRNLEDGSWEWDQDAVERAAVTDNVVELMRSKVGELPEQTQQLLGQAACAGHSFTFGDLAVLAGSEPDKVVEELQPALQAGLVIPHDGQYREVQALAHAVERCELNAGYRFLHDRVQQAFYERIAKEQRARTHLEIGHRLQAVFEREGGSDQKLLELVRHLNLGTLALTHETESKTLARLNLRAAKAAKLNGSYRLQATLVEQAQELLGVNAWQEEPGLSVELALERIEADFLLREFSFVHRRVKELLELPLPPLPRLAAQELRVRACLASGQFEEGERLGIAALAEQGITYPKTEEECIAEVLQGIQACDAWLDGHPTGFRAMPADASAEHLLCDALQATMLMCAAISGHSSLVTLAQVRMVQKTIKTAAWTPIAPYFVAAFAGGRSALLGDYRGAVRWAREGTWAAERLASPLFPECSAVRGFYENYEHPVEQTRTHYQAALRVAKTSGSFQGTSWALLGEICHIELWGGRSLEKVAAMEAAQRDMMARSGDAIGLHHFELFASYAAFLRTVSAPLPPAKSEWLSASSRRFLSMGDGIVAEIARVFEAHLFLAFGEYRKALERAEEAERYSPALYGGSPASDILLWRGLAAAKCCTSELSPDARAPLLAALEHARDRFRDFSAGCAENFLHKLRLLEAEQARIFGKAEAAMALYDEAITLARQERFLHIEGLAAQLCADFHLQAGRTRIAALYLNEARDAYLRWDARALAAFLEQRYPTLHLPSSSTDRAAAGAHTVTTTQLTGTTGDVRLDVDTTVRSAQALSRELDPKRVVAALMRLVQENAGAQCAALLLPTGSQWSVSALLAGSQVHTGLVEPLSAAHPVAATVIQYVQRSSQALVLTDAALDSRFAQDPHLCAAGIRSVLAVPLVHQGRLSGILYLEHEAANAFPKVRVHLLGVLAAQGAIALENASLYAELQAANAGLEAKVTERTAALNQALKELWSEMDVARKIQTILLPGAPRIAGYDMSAAMRPAEQVGGDYYDIFHCGGQDWALIGDVSGHGVPAGLCMMMIQSVLRAVAMTLEQTLGSLTPRRLLGLVNAAVENNLKQIGAGQYMTISALCIEGDTVRYAGLHQDLLIYRAASQTVERLETQGIWLGVTEGDISELLPEDKLRLEKGDTLLLYTDGYTEAKIDGRHVDTEGLARLFAAQNEKGLTSGALIARLFTALDQAVVQDDVTLVALRRI